MEDVKIELMVFLLVIIFFFFIIMFVYLVVFFIRVLVFLIIEFEVNFLKLFLMKSLLVVIIML